MVAASNPGTSGSGTRSSASARPSALHERDPLARAGRRRRARRGCGRGRRRARARPRYTPRPSSCGARAAARVDSRAMTCPSCGAAVSAGAFCSACGAHLAPSAAQPHAPDAPVLATTSAASALRYQLVGGNAFAAARVELAAGQAVRAEARRDGLDERQRRPARAAPGWPAQARLERVISCSEIVTVDSLFTSRPAPPGRGQARLILAPPGAGRPRRAMDARRPTSSSCQSSS